MPPMRYLLILLVVLSGGCARREQQSSTTSAVQDSLGATGVQGAEPPAPLQSDSSGNAVTPTQPRTSDADSTAPVLVTKPRPGEKVTSPLTVRGEARGTWYFEASFPVKLLDAQGNVLAAGPAEAKGDWMTEKLVPYEVTLRFTPPASGAGRIVLEKSNPSGAPKRDAKVVVPVKF